MKINIQEGLNVQIKNAPERARSYGGKSQGETCTNLRSIGDRDESDKQQRVSVGIGENS